MLLPIHVAAGVLALVFGCIALFAAKGATWHRRSGTFFVYAMLGMSASGAVMAMKPQSHCCQWQETCA